MKNGLRAVCHGQESLEKHRRRGQVPTTVQYRLSNVSVVDEDCHMQEDSSNPDYARKSDSIK